jgi:hypothetical protein
MLEVWKLDVFAGISCNHPTPEIHSDLLTSTLYIKTY